MRWSSAVSDNPALNEAVNDAALSALAGLDGESPDLAVVFVSPQHRQLFDAVPWLLKPHIGNALILGCTAGGVIGGGIEVEQRAAFSLTLAHLPGVTLAPFVLDEGQLPNEDAPPDDWHDLLHAKPEFNPQFVMLSDPFTMNIDNLVVGMDYAFPRAAKVGGLASAGPRPGINRLYLGGEVLTKGAIGVAMWGNITVDTGVAQGCKPIGDPMLVTGCHRNVLTEVDGRKPLEVLQELYGRANDHDQQLFQGSLFVGMVMDELQGDYKLGDFLIRNVMGAERETGAIYVGTLLREGQTVQFHLRDAGTATADLRSMLNLYYAEHDLYQAEGALLFSCLGRGVGLFGRPNHDSDLFHEVVGPVPLGGFFCNGEIGQVAGTTYVHGYTSSFGIFRPAK